MSGQIGRAAKRYAAARLRAQEARDALRDEVRAAHAGGATEVELAKLAGVDRMTIRAWLGKR